MKGSPNQLVKRDYSHDCAGGAAAQAAGKRQPFYEFDFQPALIADVPSKARAETEATRSCAGSRGSCPASPLMSVISISGAVLEFDGGAVSHAFQRQAQGCQSRRPGWRPSPGRRLLLWKMPLKVVILAAISALSEVRQMPSILQCIDCAQQYPIDRVIYTCGACGSLLDVTHDLRARARRTHPDPLRRSPWLVGCALQ